jgi:hypothetical protein
MQIHYCYQCNSRVDSDHAFSVDNKVYCKKCADELSSDDYFVKSEGIPPRATPSLGMQRVTPSKMGRKTPTKVPMRSPPRGTAAGTGEKGPPRTSRTGIRPASPAKGTSIRPRTSTPGAEAAHGESRSNIASAKRLNPDSRKARASSNNSMVLGLAIAAFLLISAAIVMMFFGKNIYGANPPAGNTSTSKSAASPK